MVSVQLTLPRLVAAVELPATRVGRMRLAGAEMLSTPPEVEPVTICVPLAAAEIDPTTSVAPTAVIPATTCNERRLAFRIEVSPNMAAVSLRYRIGRGGLTSSCARAEPLARRECTNRRWCIHVSVRHGTQCPGRTDLPVRRLTDGMRSSVHLKRESPCDCRPGLT